MIIYNGKKYEGKNLIVSNNKIYIDGVLQTDFNQSSDKVINIYIEGDVSNVQIESADTVNIKGNVDSIVLKTGNLNIEGDADKVEVKTGSVYCTTIKGNATVRTGNINGKVEGSSDNKGGNTSWFFS